MTTGSLATRKNHTNVYRFGRCGGGVFLESQFGKAVSVGKQLLDFFLIGYRLCGITFHSFHRTGKHDRQLRLLSRAGFLQGAFLHECKSFCITLEIIFNRA